MSSVIEARYQAETRRYSDIYQHLETLRRYASQAETVLECGVREVVSTWAFAAGLLENASDTKKLVSVDLETNAAVEEATPILKETLDYRFWLGNDLHFEFEHSFDLVFIDTWHVYGHLKRELAKMSPHVNHWIILHDTTVDAMFGESIRMRHNIDEEVKESGYPREEITRGLWPAVTEFLADHPEFKLLHRYENCNGLTILERVPNKE